MCDFRLFRNCPPWLREKREERREKREERREKRAESREKREERGEIIEGRLENEDHTFILVPSNPDPISNPLVAGIDSMAWARAASILSKTGSPREKREERREKRGYDRKG